MTQRDAPRLARGPAVVLAVVAFAAVVALAALLVPWSWVPGGRLVPARATDLFSAGQIARAEEYSAYRRAISWTGYAVSVLLLLAIAFTPPGRRVLRRATEGRRWWVAVPLATVVVLGVERLVTLPFALADHAVDRHFGLTEQGYGPWGVDQVKSLLVSCVVTTLALLVLVGVARRSPRWWFAWTSAAALVLVLAGSFLYPVLVEPVFNRFTPMADGPFRQSVLGLAAREGVHVDQVLVADASRRTTTLNAYVSGFGGTRRVVVYDTLLRQLTPAEARVVVAHELGHAKYDDVLLGTVLGAVAAAGGVALLALVLDADVVRRRAGVSGAGDPAVVGLVLALVAVGGFLASPAQNSVSRAIEARADRASLTATHAAATFVRMQQRLAVTSLADPTPPAWSQFWFGSHPTVLQRAGLPASLERAHR